LIVDGIAILAGSWITNIIPVRIIKIVSGVVFILFGLYMLLKHKKEDDEGKTYHGSAFLSGFILILLTEWGDKTQIAASLFATKFNAVLVLCGTMIALALLSFLAIYFGKIIARRIDKKILTKVAAIVFIIMGIFFFLS
jgi:putative Ca2+/H+ antiporter (TMEM165/GDT1 family)